MEALLTFPAPSLHFLIKVFRDCELNDVVYQVHQQHFRTVPHWPLFGIRRGSSELDCCASPLQPEWSVTTAIKISNQGNFKIVWINLKSTMHAQISKSRGHLQH